MSDYIKEKIEEFNKLFCNIYPGDSGMGGNDPQEPVDDWACYPPDVRKWLKKSLQEMEERTREETLSNLVVGAIPETNEYANGWNDCRHAYGDAKKALLSHKKDTGEKEIQSDLLPFEHGEEGTHYACVEMAQKFKEHMKCCGCSGHDCHPPKKEDK